MQYLTEGLVVTTPTDGLARLARIRRRARAAQTTAWLAAGLLAACAKHKDDDDEKAQSATQEQQEHAVAPAATPIDWKQLDQPMGRAGSVQPGDVYKFAFPRSDMKVTTGGVQLKPALALGGWVAFKQAGPNDAIAMGDLVLAEDEVASVMTKLQAGGVEQTALHNHLLHESPRVLYMHIHAHGDPVKLASAIRDALSVTKTPSAQPAGALPPSGPALDTAAIAATLGYHGKLNGVVYQVSVPRGESIKEGSIEIPPSMGVATAINVQPTGAGTAATTGDFVLIAAEVNPVIQALTQNGIAVTAVHSHMLTEDPRLFFLHFWGSGDVSHLTRGLRAALDKTNALRHPA
jgi:surface antigen